MCGQLACVAAVLLSVETGWQPLPESGVEYLIQIEPQLLDAFRSGEPIESDILPEVKDVRAFRITVGKGKLPRELPPAPAGTVAMTREPPAETPATPKPDPAPAASRLPPLDWSRTGLPSTPRTLAANPASKPMAAQPAAYVEPAAPSPSASAAPSQSPSDGGAQPEPSEAKRPWTVLTLALLGLFASLGGNVYLFWISLDARSRCRALARHDDEAASDAQSGSALEERPAEPPEATS